MRQKGQKLQNSLKQTAEEKKKASYYLSLSLRVVLPPVWIGIVSMAVLRNHDLFVKARADIQTKTLAGGIVTVLASVLAFLLFVAQLYAYTFPTSVHTLHLSESTQFHMLHEDRVDPFHQKRYELKGK